MNTPISDLDIIIPVSMELDWPTRESIVTAILEQHRRYGFTRFALAAPCGGWRSVAYPPREHFEALARLFLSVKNELSPHGIECGWWNTLTLKSGPSGEFTRPIKRNGEVHPFATCPLDEAFQKRFSEDIALFARIAKPAFIITEDDYSVAAAGGCFCKHHLAAFAKRQGKAYSREELVDLMYQDTPQAHALNRAYRQVSGDALVSLAAAVRKALDVESPEIPMGYMQAGGVDCDGACTEEIARAMAGPNHTPFSRLFGTFYGGVRVREIPCALYHPLHSKQHIPGDFRFYHESDTFPHTRFFTSGAHMRAIMSAAYSYGFDGSTFQTQQLLDHANEETAYGKMFAAEWPRFQAIHRIAKQCRVTGVQIDYDPFWNTVDPAVLQLKPLWTKCIGLFGIPFTTLDSGVTFWDEYQTRYFDDEVIMKKLSGTLFLDGAAAKHLCDRGYSSYIGVEIGDDVLSGTTIRFDLGAREVICDGFLPDYPGRHMPSAHMYSPPGNGKLLKMTVIDNTCEVISNAVTFQKAQICPAMTRFVNRLGGKVVVMGMTLRGNHSQSLFNYRRQRLLQELIVWGSDDFVMAKNAPDIYVIENEAIDPSQSGFLGMLTLINLCEDDLDEITLHLPSKWKHAVFSILDRNGHWQPAASTPTADGITLHCQVRHLDPVYLLMQSPDAIGPNT